MRKNPLLYPNFCLAIILLLMVAKPFSAKASSLAGNTEERRVELASELTNKDKASYQNYLTQYEQAMAEGYAKLWRLRIESFLAESHDFAQQHPHLVDFWIIRAKAAQIIYNPTFGIEATQMLNSAVDANTAPPELKELLTQLKDTGWLKPTDSNELKAQVVLQVAVYSHLPKAEEKLVLESEQGTAKAKAGLGSLYLAGRLVEKNEKKAFYWTQLAAEQGDSPAQHDLGYMYMKGIYVPKDLKKAVYWFQKAAEQGNPYAQNKLGYLYTRGKELEKDSTKAIEQFQKGAEQGNALAQYNLADIYFYGRGVHKDYAKAFHWYTMSARQGDALAQLNLGYCYEHGYGTAKNYDAALQWYQKAADQGNSRAQSNLERILKWYRK